jgi:hypothetical protein
MPLTLHVTALSVVPVTTAEYCDDAPSITVVAPERAMVTFASGGFGAAASVTAMLLDTEESAALVALIAICEELGMVPGALYRPLVEMEPTVEFPPATPFTLHLTCVLLLPETLAVYCALVPTVTLFAPLNDSVTLGGGGGGEISETERLCETVGSATLVALMVTAEDDGTAVGALYKPLAEMVPVVEFPPATPFTLQVTCLLLLPETVAVYCAVVPTVTLLAPLSDSVTVGGGGGGETSETERL